MNNNCDNITELFNDQIRELANSDKEAQKELIETIAKFEDEVPDDVKDDDDLWWDSSSPPPQFYTLVFDDDDVSLYSLDESYADFLLPSDMLEDVRLSSDNYRNVMKMPEDMLMQSVVQLLHIATPNAIYKPTCRQIIIKEWIVPVLFPVWTNADEIFSDVKPRDDDIKYSPPVITYHTIDIFNVNKRFIENIPKPNRYPVLGVSPDPNFYHEWYQTGDPYKRSQKFLDPFPFGSKYGYETNIGVVPPPSDPIHGYVWSD